MVVTRDSTPHRCCIPTQRWGMVGASILLWLMLSGVGLAEMPIPPTMSGQLLVSLSSGDISLEKVNQFVQAYLQVLQLVEQHEAQLQGAETEPEALEVEREVEAEALAIIQSVGLTRQEYLQLLGLANVDPEFSERVTAQLQELA